MCGVVGGVVFVMKDGVFLCSLNRCLRREWARQRCRTGLGIVRVCYRTTDTTPTTIYHQPSHLHFFVLPFSFGTVGAGVFFVSKVYFLLFFCYFLLFFPLFFLTNNGRVFIRSFLGR